MLERNVATELMDLTHVQHDRFGQNGGTGDVAAMGLQPGAAIPACTAEKPGRAADSVADAEACVIGGFAKVFDDAGKFVPDDRFRQRPGEIVALVERDVIVADADKADADLDLVAVAQLRLRHVVEGDLTGEG